MRVLYYDCFAGISGDMNLAAMLDLGVDESLLRAELEKLNLSDEFDLNITPDSKCGIHGTRVDVSLKERPGQHHHHAHRNLSDIRNIISKSTLSDDVKLTSLAIFARLAKAEAHVHNCTIDEIHFHEVGATDAIVDIVGAAICYHALNIDAVHCSSIELGGGFVHCAHGKLPVPAPATVELLHGSPTTGGAVPFETTTPTGAAILAEIVDHFTDTPSLTTEKTAYGIGHRDVEIPNVLRVHLSSAPAQDTTTDALLLECSIDDMSPEALSYAMERLFEAGASDVNFIPITMKKSRPGIIISVLCPPDRESALKQTLFQETTTLGIKIISVAKTMLERSSSICDTRFGPITIKNAHFGGNVLRSKPEFEECAAIARRENVPLAAVYQAIQVASH
jgi:uncharacterized protein (TIGR00299 family) protein